MSEQMNQVGGYVVFREREGLPLFATTSLDDLFRKVRLGATVLSMLFETRMCDKDHGGKLRQSYPTDVMDLTVTTMSLEGQRDVRRFVVYKTLISI